MTSKQSVTAERIKRYISLNEKIFERTASSGAHAYAKFTDLSLMQIQVIRLIEHHQPCNISKLSKSMGLSLGSTTQLIDRLVKKEYVKRVRSKTDQRVVYVELKVKARKVIDAFRKHAHTVGLHMMGKLTETEQDKMLDFFERMIG